MPFQEVHGFVVAPSRWTVRQFRQEQTGELELYHQPFADGECLDPVEQRSTLEYPLRRFGWFRCRREFGRAQGETDRGQFPDRPVNPSVQYGPTRRPIDRRATA